MSPRPDRPDGPFHGRRRHLHRPHRRSGPLQGRHRLRPGQLECGGQLREVDAAGQGTADLSCPVAWAQASADALKDEHRLGDAIEVGAWAGLPRGSRTCSRPGWRRARRERRRCAASASPSSGSTWPEPGSTPDRLARLPAERLGSRPTGSQAARLPVKPSGPGVRRTMDGAHQIGGLRLDCQSSDSDCRPAAAKRLDCQSSPADAGVPMGVGPRPAAQSRAT